ncbi:hypothetical protein QFC22_002353 [Naganishia vaughanmartiniae]|uniref:Uncharacterized protein n=1 Tax=Naganishia vaughanmartiniae TaxID=1424756 RepID=A0ACC2XCS2_9TREE|nr:hypothetical protein QFC22_002353 [Naganishia vaughanmartiniae]
MPFFSRKDKSVIPPVAPPPGYDASPVQVSNTPLAPGAAARQQLFGSKTPASTGPPAVLDPYANSRGTSSLGRAPSYTSTPGDPYGDAKGSSDRDQLFGGFTPKEPVEKSRVYGYEGRDKEEDFDEDEEIEGIKHQMRDVKQESLAGTRNALRVAREAEDTARGTLAKLADQSERIANTERHLDIAKASNQRAEDKADELRKLNRSIFRPSVTWNKEGKRMVQEEKIMDRHLRERDDREKARQDVLETHHRLNAAGSTVGDYGSSSRDGPPQPGAQAKKREERKRFQFDATASDDELEDELDENLNETLDVTRRLKSLALAAGAEIDTHNKRLGGITDKTGDLDLAIMKNTERVRRAGGKN